MLSTYSTEIYSEREIAPGVLCRLIDCDTAALDAARAIAGRKLTLRCEAEILLDRAASSDVEISDDLRERLAVFAGLLPDLQALVAELRSAVYA
jgi:hypothetical protein